MLSPVRIASICFAVTERRRKKLLPLQSISFPSAIAIDKSHVKHFCSKEIDGKHCKQKITQLDEFATSFHFNRVHLHFMNEQFCAIIHQESIWVYMLKITAVQYIHQKSN